MHMIIGEFVFSVEKKTPLSKFNRVSAGVYSETPLLNGARSERTGRALEKIDLSAKWIQSGAAVSVDKLRALMPEPQQVSDGEGRNLGKWTIQALTEGRSEMIHNGHAMVTDVSFQLMEYRNED